MRSGWSALLVLLAYLIVVFILFRVVDRFTAAFWWQPSTIVDPILLSVKQLKQLLETRGVSYTGYIEKKELAQLVAASAVLVQGEVDELDETSSGGGSLLGWGSSKSVVASSEGNTFEGSAHFYEAVRDTKDGVWLVQVVPHYSRGNPQPLLDDYTWRLVTSQVAPFDIRTGIFNCRLDPRLCKRKGWDKPLLLLALPKGTKPKDEVVMTTCTLRRPQAIIEWLREELSIRMKKVADFEDLEKNWLGGSKNGTSSPNDGRVKVLLLTHLLHPPLFLSALSIKFTGRMTFGIFSVKKEDSNQVAKLPTYLVVTPEKTVVYGHRRMEHFNLRSMNIFLATVQPEANDVFILSLLLVNMFAIIHALQGPFESWLRLAAVALWDIIACNLVLFVVWLLVLRWWSGGGVWMSEAVRCTALSWVGTQMRCDWVRLLRRPWLLAVSLAAFGVLVRKRRTPTMNSPFPPPPPPPSPPSPQPHHLMAEERVELAELIEWLALPNLFLSNHRSRWVRPLDYVDDLVMWRHGRRSATASLMDNDNDGVITTLRSLSSCSSDSDSPPPSFQLHWSPNCPICLESFCRGDILCALPCGHCYHRKCILEWLRGDNHQCPVCRWPAYESKNPSSNLVC